MKKSIASLALILAPFSFVAAQPLEIAVVTKAKESSYWTVVRDGVNKAKADLAKEGVIVNVVFDAPDREDQAEEQKKIVSALVQKKVSAIVLAPAHSMILVPAVEEAKAANIPVVIIDSLIGSDVPVSTIATNNFRAGLLAGRQLAESLHGKGNVALFRFVKGHGSTQPREQGFLEAMKKYPNIKVVSSDVMSGATTADATKNATALVQKFGAELNGVFAPNLQSTEGMLAALRETGFAGKISFIGFDSTDALVEAVKSGQMQGLVVQKPFMMGEAGLKTAAAAAQKKPIEKVIDAEIKIVTKENLDTPEVQKLLKP